MAAIGIGTTTAGLIAFALVCVIFCVVRRRLDVLVALWIVVVAGFATSSLLGGGGVSIDSLITVVGLALHAFGLLIVRVMLARSVSLRLLERCADGRSIEEFHDHVSRRLEDVQRWRLASSQDGLYRLTPLGRLTASMMAMLYALTREGERSRSS